MKLTRRGRIVRNIAVIILVFAVLWLVEYVTTPPICRGKVETLSQFCLDLRFPNT